MTQTRNPNVLLLSHGRTLSNLFVKLMSKQDDFEQAEYHFHGAFMYLRKELGDKPLIEQPEGREKFYQMIKDGYNKFFQDVENAYSKNKPVFFKNHVFQTWQPSVVDHDIWGADPCPSLHLDGNQKHTNPTMLPDSFLLSAVPIFIIRHPLMQTESWYRAIQRIYPVDIKDPFCKLSANTNYCRQLFDWYKAQVPADVYTGPNPKGPGPFMPIIVDADDLLEGTDTIERVCERANFSKDKVLYSWDTVSDDTKDVVSRSYLKGLWESTGVDKSKSSKGVTAEAKHAAWKDEFGQEVADFLLASANEHMPDYEYMLAQKI